MPDFPLLAQSAADNLARIKYAYVNNAKGTRRSKFSPDYSREMRKCLNLSLRGVLLKVRSQFRMVHSFAGHLVKRKIFWTGVTVLILGIGLAAIVTSFASSQGSPALDARRAEAIERAAEYALYRNRPQVADRDNAFLVLTAISPRLKAANMSLTREEWEQIHFGRGPYTSQQQQLASEVIAAHSEIYQALAQAASCPAFDTKMDYDHAGLTAISPIIFDVSTARSLAGWGSVKARHHFTEGELDQGVEICLQICRLASLVEHDPESSSTIVGLRSWGLSTANAIVRSGPISVDSRRRLDACLAESDSLQAFKTSQVVWHGQLMEEFQSIRNQSFRSRANSLGGWGNDWESAFEAVFSLDADETMCQDAFDTVSGSTFDVPLYQCRPTLEAVDAMLASKYGQVVSSQLSHNLLHRINAEKNRARIRCFRVLLAAIENDQLPQTFTLADVNLPPEDLIDPFNGQPLRLKQTPQGMIVYSVGPDLVDDGGLAGTDDEGFRPDP